MKKNILFILFFILISSLFSQVKNINSLQGTWTGGWINDAFLSTGDAQIMVVVDEPQNKVIATFNIGGTALGQTSIPVFVEESVYNEIGAEISLTHDIWGSIEGSIDFATGEFSGTAVDNPVNPSVGDMTGAGILTSDSLKSTFTMVFAGDMITGGMDLAKENAITTPTNLTAVENTLGSVELSWIVTSSNQTGFKIDRWSASEGWVEIADLGASEVNYTDNSVEENSDYKYRIAAYNTDTESEFSNETEITTVTGVEDEEILHTFALGQNYPNPFNPSTKIKFSVGNFSPVKVEVFHQTGELVSTLFNGYLNGGEYELNFNAHNLASGIYYYRMISNDFVSTKKMILLR